MSHSAETPPIETEIKLLIRPDDVGRLKHHPLLRQDFEKSAETSELNSVYFDDRRQTLRKCGLSLRVRHIGRERVQTIKMLNGDGGPAQRAEWESGIKTDEPDLSLAAGTALAPVLDKKLRGPLEPVFETRVARAAFPLRFGSSEIIVALDQGKIDTGRESTAVSELELELKRGSLTDLFQLALRLNESVPLTLSYAAKSARGYALVDRSKARAATAAPVQLRPGMSAAEAFRLIAHECLRHLVDNWSGVVHGDAEALHQMRIAERRLRTAISLFRDLVAGEELAGIRGELKWLREQTGPARDLDVFITEVMAPIWKEYRQRRGVNSLYQHLRRKRLKSHKAAREALTSDRYRRLVLQIAAWVEGGDWSSSEDEAARARQRGPIESYAAERLRGLRRRIRKRGKSVEDLDEAARHQLRVQVKKLRYATEFFASLFEGKKARKRKQAFGSTLRRFQNALGALNDVAVRKSLSEEIADKVGGRFLSREAGRERIFVAGLVAGHQEAHVTSLLDEAKEAFFKFRKVKSFWKATPAGTEEPQPNSAP